MPNPAKLGQHLGEYNKIVNLTISVLACSKQFPRININVWELIQFPTHNICSVLSQCTKN